MTDTNTGGGKRLRGLVRRLTQFRLRTLMIVMFVAAIGLATVGRHYYLQHRRSAALDAIAEVGGMALNSASMAAAHADKVERVYLAKITDEQLLELAPHLAFLPHLHELDIVNSVVSDEGLAGLERLPQLKVLVIFDTKVTPEGLALLGDKVPGLDIRQEMPDPVATGLAMRPIYHHAVTALAVSPDRSLLAAGDGRGQLWLWKLDSRGLPQGEPRNLQAHADWLFDIDFDSQGKRLVTGGGDNRIVIWETATLRQLSELNGHDDDVHAVAFALGDRKLVSAGDDMTVRVWDVATGTQEHVLSGHDDTIPALAISPDGQTAASASRDGDIRLWDVASGQPIDRLTGHSADVLWIEFAPNGNYLVSASYDHTVRIWEQASGQPVRDFVHDDWAFAALLHGDQLISAGRDGSLRRWDAASGRLVVGHNGQGNISRIVATAGDTLAVASAEGRIRFWNRDLSHRLASVRVDLPGIP